VDYPWGMRHIHHVDRKTMAIEAVQQTNARADSEHPEERQYNALRERVALRPDWPLNARWTHADCSDSDDARDARRLVSP
jgi:hypothetical protein